MFNSSTRDNVEHYEEILFDVGIARAIRRDSGGIADFPGHSQRVDERRANAAGYLVSGRRSGAGYKIYVAGGFTGNYNVSVPLSVTQIYDPAADTWSTGTPLPTPLGAGASAVVNHVWYVMGGTTDATTFTSATWAYDPRASEWIAKAPMPVALQDAGAAVYNDMIYVVGGRSDSMFRASTVERYDPANDAWTEEAPLLEGKSEPSVALFGTMIVAADGATSQGSESDNGDNEAYNVVANTWTPLAYDPTPRNQACSGGIGPKLYVAGGGNNAGQAITLTESFDPYTNNWRTLVPMPQATQFPGSAVYLGKLYCFGGGALNPDGPTYNNVQIYRP